jgi:sugar (pentulose or hexulose) kinase
MFFITVDLGTTNIKVCCFNRNMQPLSMESVPVEYFTEDDQVEFDPEAYFINVLHTIKRCLDQCGIREVEQIVLTGQAESLIVLDEEGKPLCRGISWLDNRSKHECRELKSRFDTESFYRITGQPDIVTTWPITKILWLKHNEKKVFGEVSSFVLLKDFIIYRLTGLLQGEFSIYNFTYYFDIIRKCYITEILDYVGIEPSKLPALTMPCSLVGSITADIAEKLNLVFRSSVNCGTLDHFAGMIGTGNIEPGSISESTGTVMSIATLTDKPLFSKEKLGCHFGPFENSYVLLATCESGGISLEWFKRQFMPEISYAQLDLQAAEKQPDKNLLFLPYINGINSPDFIENASGVFFGLRHTTQKIDMAIAVMEGVAHLLAVNTEVIKQNGIGFNSIVSTGGGSKSDIWCQMKADIANTTVLVPQNTEAASLGAAMIGAVSAKVFTSYEHAVKSCVKINKKYAPRTNPLLRQKHVKYKLLFSRMAPLFNDFASN